MNFTHGKQQSHLRNMSANLYQQGGHGLWTSSSSIDESILTHKKQKYDLTSLIIVDLIIYTKAKCELTI